nr:hypothetical protein [Clostridium thermarum]
MSTKKETEKERAWFQKENEYTIWKKCS